MIEQIPTHAKQMVDEYQNLPLGGKKVQCPYYINVRLLRMGLRVLIGKGSPDEITQESLIYEKLRGVDFGTMTIDEIRDFLVKRHIGVDCSGFAVHVLDTWLTFWGKRHLWSYLCYPKISLYRKIAKFFRPVENITADLLTGDLNTHRIENINNIRCGDLIRSKGLKGGNHVALIIQTQKEQARVVAFKYAHSSRWGKEHGVRIGEVKVIKPNGDLLEQEWREVSGNEHWLLEEIKKDTSYAEIRRFRSVPLY